jgi:hypothetical protein
MTTTHAFEELMTGDASHDKATFASSRPPHASTRPERLQSPVNRSIHVITLRAMGTS